jgi:hypothetical protein
MGHRDDLRNIEDVVDEADDRVMCPRCSKDRVCCEMTWQDCESCDGGTVVFEDFDGEEEDGACDICEGEGGWWLCDCDDNGQHKVSPPGSTGAG